MCGICGVINFDGRPVKEAEIRKMMRFQKHRGPDDEGVFIKDNIGLGFVRLSIIDLTESGHQPMYSDDNRFVIIFNGEVYNYLELREELIQKGHTFRSDTDTEVVLKSFIEWGKESLNKFTGMWAFAIYDRKNRTLFISRDRFGIKPFYYFKDDYTFIFSSEIPPLLKFRSDLRKTNNEIIFDYLLTNRTNHSEDTFFESVKKLQHSHNIEIDLEKNTFEIKRWYNLADSKSLGYESPEEFKNDLISSINMQLRSDVPVGLCLSGGLDSSSIGASISSILGRNDIFSFSAVYGLGLKGDESEFIKEFDGYINNIYFTYPDADSFLLEMNDFIETIAEPVPGTSEYAEYKVMQLARKHCTVILNGQGVDEYFAGYHYFVGILLKEYISNLNISSFFKELYYYYSKHNSLFHVKSLIFFLSPKSLRNRLLANKYNFVSSDFIKSSESQQKMNSIDLLYDSGSLRDSFINHFEYKFEHHLLWADKSGMRFSLETRFPFLDHNIVEKAINTDISKIYTKGVTKVILRDAMKGILPEKIRMRMDKVGYSTPQEDWFRGKKFQTLFYDIVNSYQFSKNHYFDRDKTLKFYKNFLLRKNNNGNEIWKMINMELWLRKFIY